MELNVLNSFLIAANITFVVVMIVVLLMIYFLVRKGVDHLNQLVNMTKKQCNCESKE